ncbi:mannitol dehydrogenase family protein [Sphingobacterium sp. Mn56C]|uniref:mannitol dehydrogenase family protein n=1 Tax=Sphingobacterium sp. Mn56C TaxID=3395261 RepID=UPI003BCED937
MVSYNYKPEEVTAGIVHIGVGNFHRAHQQFYINSLLTHTDQLNWGICGISMLPTDKPIVDSLRAQDLQYSLTICGRDGNNEVHKISALKELISAVEEPAAVVQKIAEKAIKIITLTITEGGYNLDKTTNEFNLADEKVKQDIANPSAPQTVFGFIAEGLRLRRKYNHGGLTILSCDNLQHNGNTAKKAFLTFLAAQDPALAAWAETFITFPNSMVDRITPATTAADITRLNAASGWDDKAPVYCEDFHQWVIEDNFAAGRPALERVGVQFTNDVTAFENMKLSLLNASHTLLSYPSFLKGYRKVDEAMQDRSMRTFIRNFMDIDITPYVPAPADTDLEVYKQTLIERFANHSVSDQVSRLCFDGISKFPVYIIPNLIKMLRDGKDLTRMAFLFASYRHYLVAAKDDLGQQYSIAEPWLHGDDASILASKDPLDFLQFSPFKSVNLSESAAFVNLYGYFVIQLQQYGMAKTLQTIVG